jgi:hypothetical protein
MCLLHVFVESCVQVAGEDYLIVAHESRASRGFAAGIGGRSRDDHGVRLVIAQDGVQGGFEKSVKLVLHDFVFELSLPRLNHVRVHLIAGLSLPQNAVFRDRWKFEQHQTSVRRAMI